MTGWVKQHAVVRRFEAAFRPPDHVVVVPHAQLGDLLVAHRAGPVLLFPQVYGPASSAQGCDVDQPWNLAKSVTVE